MFTLEEIKKSFLVSLWFIFLTFPLVVIRVNSNENTIDWRWKNMALVGIASFILSFFWRDYFRRKKMGQKKVKSEKVQKTSALRELFEKNKQLRYGAISLIVFLAVAYPFVLGPYQTNIMISALIYIVLGLGLNIVVGLAGLLDLGYVAFYAVGAYFYAILNTKFGLGFWTVLPLAMVLAGTCGLILGFPVLRLRGDYLAIVTLGFGEIIRLILENWNEFSGGPSGIAQIAKPAFFVKLNNIESIPYIYYIMIVMVIITIFVVTRLQDSRMGRAWIALREDEIACQAMGIDTTKTKLTAFAMGASWAGMCGVMLSVKTSYINPASFTFMESAIILSIVVLGGMGSVLGVILGALILSLLPEYLRAFDDYRMLVFGATMVIMMIFRPQGIISNVRRTYKIIRN
jgi:branched-chain amino acid transport system permease protein